MDLPTENIQVIFPSYTSGLNRNIVRFQPVMSLVWKAKQFRICSAHSCTFADSPGMFSGFGRSILECDSKYLWGNMSCSLSNANATHSDPSSPTNIGSDGFRFETESHISDGDV